MDLWKIEERLSKIEERLDKIEFYIDERKVDKKTFSEDDYWKGDVPPDKFDNYLNKYGYEYTPPNFPSRY